jgi:hypothetical protein
MNTTLPLRGNKFSLSSGIGDGSTPSTVVGSVSQSNDKLIVGVDFGTTYSGVAAVYSATPDDIEIIKSWPGGNGTILQIQATASFTMLTNASRDYF